MTPDKLKRPKDKKKYTYNVFTGELEVVVEFNVDRIITCQANLAGTTLSTFDSASGTHLESGPQIVTDEYGNILVV